MAEQQEKSAWDYATPIITGLGSAAITGLWNNYTMQQQNEFNKREAEKQRQYETQMSNTAYQRGYADMAAAGLNPHLAGGQGGASTPTGTAATSAAAMPLDINGSINAASNAAITRAQIKNLNAQTTLTEQEAGKSKAETKRTEILTEIEPVLMKAQAELANAQNEKTRQEKITELKRTAIAGWQELQASMDYKKRKWGYDQELEIYTKQLEIQLYQLGYDTSTIGIIVNSIWKNVGQATNALSPFNQYIQAGSGYNDGYKQGYEHGYNTIHQYD